MSPVILVKVRNRSASQSMATKNEKDGGRSSFMTVCHTVMIMTKPAFGTGAPPTDAMVDTITSRNS